MIKRVRKGAPGKVTIRPWKRRKKTWEIIRGIRGENYQVKSKKWSISKSLSSNWAGYKSCPK